MILHWQQWYMFIGYAVSVICGIANGKPVVRFFTVLLTVLGFLVLWTGGFFHGGVPQWI